MKRFSYWKDQHERAHRALQLNEWWNGREWRPSGTVPRTATEAGAYRTAQARLGEILDAMVSGDDAVQLTKAARFDQSANALKKNDTRKVESHDAWLTLAARFGEVRLLKDALTVELLDECVEELKRGTFKTRKGEPWTRDGIKSYLRRRRRL